MLHPQLENFNQLLFQVRTVPAVVKRNTFGDFIKITHGDTCIVSGGEHLQEDWHVRVSKIYKVGPVSGKYHLLFDGTYYIPGFLNGRIVKHPWTQTTELLPREYVRLSIQPVQHIKYKVILFPEPTNLHQPSYYLAINFDKPSLLQEVRVPVWPQEADTLRVYGGDNEIWYGKVNRVNIQGRSVQVSWYQERRPGVWSLTRQADSIHFNSILCIVQVRQVPGGFMFV